MTSAGNISEFCQCGRTRVGIKSLFSPGAHLGLSLRCARMFQFLVERVTLSGILLHLELQTPPLETGQSNTLNKQETRMPMGQCEQSLISKREKQLCKAAKTLQNRCCISRTGQNKREKLISCGVLQPADTMTKLPGKTLLLTRCETPRKFGQTGLI